MPGPDQLLEPAKKPKPPDKKSAAPPVKSNPRHKLRAPAQTCDRDTGDGTCRAIELEPSVFKIDFGRVFVGQQAIKTFSVRNPDRETAVEIQDTEVLQSGFGDFEPHSTNGVVQPGELFNITIAFRPSEAGEHSGKVRVLGDFASSSRVEVRGIGDETKDARTKRAQRQNAEIARLKQTPGQKHLVERQRADTAVQRWKDSATDFADATAKWANLNWTEFYRHTGGDFAVSWTEGHLNNIVGDALSNLAGLVTEHPLVSFLMSTVSSLLWDAAFTVKGNEESEELVHEKGKQLGDIIQSRLETSHSIEAAANARARALASTAFHRVWSAADVQQIETVREWASLPAPRLPNLADRSLAKNLLMDWALQRARGSNGESSANSAAYAEVRKTHFNLDKGEDYKRRDLFIYQARHDWAKLSLSRTQGIEHALRDSVTRHEREGKVAGLTGSRLAAFVAGKLDYQVWSEFEVTDRVATAAALNVPDDKLGLRMTCRMVLEVDGESVAARHFYYYGNGATHAVRSP